MDDLEKKSEFQKDVEQKLKETRETIDSLPDDESTWSLEQQKKVVIKLEKVVRSFNKLLRNLKTKKQ